MNNDLKKKRVILDKIDDSIILLLSKRKNIVQQIGKIKKEQKIAVFDKKREEVLLERIRKKAKQQGLHPQFAEQIYRTILVNSKKVQNEIK